jgi:hypothetical protein
MDMQLETGASQVSEPARIADRYDVHEVLGRGGMACVYRVTDSSSGRQVALKQMLLTEQSELRATFSALFEREFHTLALLSHPRVIAVYEYGVSASGPYYTMELLDGGDMRDLAPLPWPEVCRLLFDVCSSLALLHSRRLLHRDISPRNIRCTRDGEAKLIDFGAMAPMSSGGNQIVGTPAFTPPETVHRLAIDARTDLFSLGATLYYALTKQFAFPARTFSDLLSAWNYKPPPPSARVPGIPAALDDLVMSMLSLEPALRPQSAFEVMQRLAAVANLPCSEPAGVSRSYLATPVLVGREDVLGLLRERVSRALAGRGGGLLVRAATGLGRSRILDACALEAKTLGATVLRANTGDTRDSFEVALKLTRHLLEAVPNDVLAEHFPELLNRPDPGKDEPDEAARVALRLGAFTDLKAEPAKLQQAISRFMLTISRTHPLVLTVDNVQLIDEPSAAVLVALVDRAHRGSLLVAMTAESDLAEASQAIDVLARRCEEISLSALDRDQTQALLGSVFGDVANLGLLTDEIYKIALGNPRQSLDVAQHLLDKGLISYASGTWTLPRQLSATDLPRSAEEAIRARIANLDPLARCLAEAQALAFDNVFTRDQYHALRPDVATAQIDAAISELLSKQALAGDGQHYTLANRVWTAAFEAGLSPSTAEERHRALAEMFRDRSGMAMIHHLFAAGCNEEGLEALLARHREYEEKFDLKTVMSMNAAQMGPSYLAALATAQHGKRSPRTVHELRRWLASLSVASDSGYYWQTAPEWLAQLKLDSGLAAWEADTECQNAGERITRALQSAQQNYLATPEAERVYRVDEAIRLLAQYVAVSIAIGARAMHTELLASLPELLEPFAPLSPVIEAIWQNSLATRETNRDGKYESGRLRWIDVHAKLSRLTGADLQHVDVISNAVAFAVGMSEAVLGMASATTWAARLDQDPMQRLSALYLRKIVRLEQGDWNGADRIRRDAEVLGLQARAPQMFSTLLSVELNAHAQARDLVGVKEIIERMRPLAARYPGWVPYLHLAEARFQLIRDDLPAAKSGFEHCIALAAGKGDAAPRKVPIWIGAHAGLAEVLLALDRPRDAYDCALAGLRVCDTNQIDAQTAELTRVLALSEAKLGDFGSAIARLEAMIQKQIALGVSGLKLGLSYETRARVAIWDGDEVALESYARLTAREYRHGTGCPLGARYERLMNEARRCGFHVTIDLSDFESSTQIENSRFGTHNVTTMVSQAMAGIPDADDRARRALRLVCNARAARGGHLYLVAPSGVDLAASYGLPEPPAGLVALVREFVTQEALRSETMTVVATNTLAGELPSAGSLAQVGGTSYDLLLLSCVVESLGTVVGVIAAAADEARTRSTHQAQLLAAVALHLLSANDNTLPDRDSDAGRTSVGVHARS